MLKRLLIVFFGLFMVVASWVVFPSLMMIAIFKQRHPNHCMAEYYNKVTPGEMRWTCKDWEDQ